MYEICIRLTFPQMNMHQQWKGSIKHKTGNKIQQIKFYHLVVDPDCLPQAQLYICTANSKVIQCLDMSVKLLFSWISKKTANKVRCILRVMKIHNLLVYSLSYFCSVSSLPPPFPLCLIPVKPHSVPLSQEYLHAHFTPEDLFMCNHYTNLTKKSQV